MCACATTISAHGVTCIYKKPARVSLSDKNLWLLTFESGIVIVFFNTGVRRNAHGN